MTATEMMKNRTGMFSSLTYAEEMRESDELPRQDAPPPGPTDDDVRAESIRESGAVGSLSDRDGDPVTAPLLDSLGGRLAFERGGVRLYDALLRKAAQLAAAEGLEGCADDLERIRVQEADHAQLLEQIIERNGGDPTLETPSADLQGVMSSGLLAVVHDPRTSLFQCLQAAVVAELADVECWTALARSAGSADEGDREGIDDALAHELEHLAILREWIRRAELRAGHDQRGTATVIAAVIEEERGD